MNELITWFQGRPKWLQEAARLLLANGRLSESDIANLTSKCMLEAAGNEMAAVAPFPANTLRVCRKTSPRGSFPQP